MPVPTPTKPLAGVRVLDFSKILAGPLCTQYLADMGAEIIKIEPIETGDDTRAWPPFAGQGMGAVFLSANRGKRSLAINLKEPEGLDLALSLARTADVAIESFGSGVAERLGIHEEALRAVNPDIVYCSISGFGRTGPLRDAPGYDVVLQAYCGVMALTGEEGGPYMRSPISPIDQTTGMHALTGILAALYGRKSGAAGSRVEVSLFETALGLMAYNLQSYWIKDVEPARAGSSHESLCPYQVFEAADGPILIAVANDNLWRRFCGVAGLGEIVADPRFATNPDRVANRAETVRLVQSAVAKQSVAWWMRELSAIRVPCAPINGPAKLMREPHTAESGMVLEAGHPATGLLRTVAQPVRFNGETRRMDFPPPAHGEHGHAILTEMGLSPEAIAALASKGVVQLPDAPSETASHAIDA